MTKQEAIIRIKAYIEVNAGYLVPEQVINVCLGLGMLPPPSVFTLPNGELIQKTQWEEE